MKAKRDSAQRTYHGSPLAAYLVTASLGLDFYLCWRRQGACRGLVNQSATHGKFWTER